MADHRTLGRLGWAFGGITAAVLLIAAVVVTTYSPYPANAGAARVTASAPPSPAH